MKLLYYCLIFVQTWKALSCQSIYPIQGETSAIIVSPFSRFRFVISMYCESTIFLPCKCVTSETKEYFVSRTNTLLAGTLRSIDADSESIAIRRGLFNQGTGSYAHLSEKGKFLQREKVLKHLQDLLEHQHDRHFIVLELTNMADDVTCKRSINRCVFLNLLCLGLL